MKATIGIAALIALICASADASGLRKLEKPAEVDIPSQASENQNTENSGVNGLFGSNAASVAPIPGAGIDGQANGVVNGIGLGVNGPCCEQACAVIDPSC